MIYSIWHKRRTHEYPSTKYLGKNKLQSGFKSNIDFDVPSMPLSANVIEHPADQFCHRCQSIFSQLDSFRRLAESEGGFAHYDLAELERSYKHGCPFGAFIAQDSRGFDTMKSRGDRGIVLNSTPRAFSGGLVDLEPGHVDYLWVWYKGNTGRLHLAEFLDLSTPIGTLPCGLMEASEVSLTWG